MDALVALDAANPAPKKKRNRKRKQKVSPPPSDQDTISIDADNQDEKEKELNELKLEEETSKVVDGSDTFLNQQQHQGQEESPENSLSDDDEDGGEWITPKNVVQRKQLDAFGCISSSKAPEQVTVACITNDFAMQVINAGTLNLLQAF